MRSAPRAARSASGFTWGRLGGVGSRLVRPITASLAASQEPGELAPDHLSVQRHDRPAPGLGAGSTAPAQLEFFGQMRLCRAEERFGNLQVAKATQLRYTRCGVCFSCVGWMSWG